MNFIALKGFGSGSQEVGETFNRAKIRSEEDIKEEGYKEEGRQEEGIQKEGLEEEGFQKDA